MEIVEENRKRQKTLEQLGVDIELAHNIACTRKAYYQI